MARPSNEFLMAWSSLTSADAEPGWQAIALPSAGPLQLRAGRRSPGNAEAVLVCFPSAKLVAADKLPEGQGFAVERADPDHSGKLSFEEAQALPFVARYFREIDTDHNGEASWHEVTHLDLRAARRNQMLPPGP